MTPNDGAGRILVVDDDSGVQNVIRRVLGSYEVIFAQSATGALGRIVAGCDFDAIVCDFRMPGMGGMQFHEAVSKIHPALAHRILFITGDEGAPDFTRFVRRARCPWVPKPFDVVQLRNAVAAAAAVPLSCGESSSTA